MKTRYRLLCVATSLWSCSLMALPLPVKPPETLAPKNYISQVNSDRTITWRLWAPSAKAVEVVTGSTPDSYVSHPMQKDAQGIWHLPARHRRPISMNIFSTSMASVHWIPALRRLNHSVRSIPA